MTSLIIDKGPVKLTVADISFFEEGLSLSHRDTLLGALRMGAILRLRHSQFNYRLQLQSNEYISHVDLIPWMLTTTSAEGCFA